MCPTFPARMNLITVNQDLWLSINAHEPKRETHFTNLFYREREDIRETTEHFTFSAEKYSHNFSILTL